MEYVARATEEQCEELSYAEGLKGQGQRGKHGPNAERRTHKTGQRARTWTPKRGDQNRLLLRVLAHYLTYFWGPNSYSY